jgi:hypothetical protein
MTSENEQRFMKEHQDLLQMILSTVQKLRGEGDYNSLALLSAALAGVASGLMDECNAVLVGLNGELNS